MKIEQYTSPNRGSRNSHIPDMVVCHIAEGTYSGTISHLCNPDTEVSSHFVVAKDGRIAQLVDLKNAAWCNGTTVDQPSDKRHYSKSTLGQVRTRKTNANYYTVSIEFEGRHAETKGELTGEQLRAAVDLIRHIRKEIKSIYGVDLPIDRQHIVGHYEINPITKPCCPGGKFQFDELISRVRQPEATTYCVHVPGVSTYGECESIKQWVQNNAPYNVIIQEE